MSKRKYWTNEKWLETNLWERMLFILCDAENYHLEKLPFDKIAIDKLHKKALEEIEVLKRMMIRRVFNSKTVEQFNSLTHKQEVDNGNADKDKREDTRVPDVQGKRTMEAAAVHVLVDERGTDRARGQGQDRGLHEESATGGRVN